MQAAGWLGALVTIGSFLPFHTRSVLTGSLSHSERDLHTLACPHARNVFIYTLAHTYTYTLTLSPS